MTINTEFFIKMDNINRTITPVEPVLVKITNKIYDFEGKEIQAFYKKTAAREFCTVSYGDKMISLDEIRAKFRARFVANPEIEIIANYDNELYVSASFRDTVTMYIFISGLSNFLYDIFDKEVEF